MTWRPIEELLRDPDAQRGHIILASSSKVMGQYSGSVSDAFGTDWFIDDAFYDGDEEPEFFLTLPAIPPT